MPKRELLAAASGLPDREVRYVIETMIDRLIAILDLLDPDPDLEPSLGWAVYPDDSQIGLCATRLGVALDAEHDDGELERDTSDDEPARTRPDVLDQTDWRVGAVDVDRPARRPRGDLRAVASVEGQLAALARRLGGTGDPVAVVTGPDGHRHLLRTCS